LILEHGYKVATAMATRFRHQKAKQRQNMAEKFIEIRIPKATLYLTTTEILAHLPDQIKAIGLKRGKAFIRARDRRKRQPAVSDSISSYLGKSFLGK